jgi:hypothetical protein
MRQFRFYLLGFVKGIIPKSYAIVTQRDAAYLVASGHF